MNAFCDVLVVGSGPAGLMAAKAAGRTGRARHPAELGPPFRRLGQLVRRNHRRHAGGRMGRSTVAAELGGAATMSACCRARRSGAITTTTRWPRWSGSPTTRQAPAKGEPRHRYWTIRARTVVLATGAFERPLVFPGNDRPGVMLAMPAERYANEFGVLPGEKIALFTNNDSAYRAAAGLKKAGAPIVAIVDVRADSRRHARAGRRSRRGILAGHAVVATEGGKALSGIKVQRFDMRPARSPAKRAASMPTAC